MVDIATLATLAVTLSSSAVVSADKDSLAALKKGEALMMASAGVGQSTSNKVGEFKMTPDLQENIGKAAGELNVSPNRVMDEVQAIALALREKLQGGDLTFNVKRDPAQQIKGKDTEIG